MAAVVLLLSRGGAPAMPVCDAAHSDSRCGWRVRGAESEETARTRGEEILHFSGGYALRSAGAFLIELRHTRAGEYVLSARAATRESAIASGRVTAGDWRRFLAFRARIAANAAAARRRIAEEDAAARRTAKGRGTELLIVCADGGGVSVDSVLHGRIEHVGADDCRNTALDPIIDAVPRLAYRLLPGCAALGNYGVLCPLLAGDRAVAARFAAPINHFNQQFCDVAAAAPGAAYRIGTANDGSGGVAADEAGVRQILCVGEFSYFQVGRYTGANGTVMVTGLARSHRYEASSSPHGRDVDAVAPFRELWRVDGDAVSLEDYRVGKFGEIVY